MDFNSTRPIYLQICDDICEKILSGELQPDGRISSVREYGASIGVNPNTVMRSYEKLTMDGIIYNTRGIGYFVSPEAKDRIMQQHRKVFLEEELPRILRRMQLLGIDPAEVFGKRSE